MRLSSRCSRAIGCFAVLLAPVAAQAQQAERLAERQQDDLREGIAEPDCAADSFQRDTIVVCGNTSREETQRHMSVLPAPVASDRVIIREIERPPCWVEPTGGVCLRGGFRPPQVVLIDLDKFPDALSPEEAALVERVEEERAAESP